MLPASAIDAIYHLIALSGAKHIHNYCVDHCIKLQLRKCIQYAHSYSAYCICIFMQQLESGYGSENGLRRHGSKLSLTSTASVSTISTSSFKVSGIVFNSVRPSMPFQPMLIYQFFSFFAIDRYWYDIGMLHECTHAIQHNWRSQASTTAITDNSSGGPVVAAVDAFDLFPQSDTASIILGLILYYINPLCKHSKLCCIRTVFQSSVK